MKELFENFRRFIEESSVKEMTTIFHFTDSDKPELVLDPLEAQRNANPHSKNEWNTSMVPRVFFYIDLDDQESFFNSSTLYSTEIPTEDIYFLASDEKELIKQSMNEYNRIDFDELLRLASGWSNEGENWFKTDGVTDYLMYELVNGMKVLVSFVPVVVRKHNELFGGTADFKSESDFDSEQLKKGIEVEYEHTNDYDLAKEIAMDHLAEDPKYYDKLPEDL
jgi:hypothetical protein